MGGDGRDIPKCGPLEPEVRRFIPYAIGNAAVARLQATLLAYLGFSLQINTTVTLILFSLVRSRLATATDMPRKRQQQLSFLGKRPVKAAGIVVD
jgi:hypothetical protein